MARKLLSQCLSQDDKREAVMGHAKKTTKSFHWISGTIAFLNGRAEVLCERQFPIMHFRILCLVLVVFLGFVAQASGATYYVSPSGTDTNPGTEELPWRTLQKAANTLNPGDLCLIQEGTYTESVTISRSGLSDAPIVFKSIKTHRAVIEGSIWIKGSYIIIDGFTIKLKDGSGVGISVSGNNNEVSTCYITTDSTNLGLNNHGIAVGGNYNKVSNSYIEKVCFGLGVTGNNHLIEHNEVFGLKLNGNCGDVDYMRFFGSNHVIRNNYFHGINYSEVGSAHVDCFQTFDNGGPAYSISNVVVESNYCSDAAQGMMLEGKIYKQSRGLIVRNNVFARCGAWCVCAVDIADVHFYNNTCDTTGGIHGMWCRGNGYVGSCEFKNNIIYGTGSLYGVFETASLIDGTPESPGKNNLLFKPGTTITGYSNDIKNQDPMFVDPVRGNYALRDGSPAIDSGVEIYGWYDAKDAAGNPRPLGLGWDIGAYEYVSSRPIPPKNLRLVK
ncbi:MAG: choice-of-anchor Q domain-containing protein [Candidatus Methanomethylicaceae archaeon]